jgi:hypothetical protein
MVRTIYISGKDNRVRVSIRARYIMTFSRKDMQELFSTGVSAKVPIPGDEDNTLDFFVRKLTPGQQEKAMRQAQASRIRLSKLWDRDDNDNDKIILMDELDQIGDNDDKVKFLAENEIASKRPAMEQELSEEDKWAEDSKIQTLTDAWTEEMLDLFTNTPEGEDLPEECNRIWLGLKEFSDELEHLVRRATEEKEMELLSLDEDAIERKVFDVLVEHHSSMEWLRVYRNYQMLYGVLEEESRKRVFDQIDQVDEMPLEIYRSLLNAITELQISPVEVKS